MRERQPRKSARRCLRCSLAVGSRVDSCWCTCSHPHRRSLGTKKATTSIPRGGRNGSGARWRGIAADSDRHDLNAMKAEHLAGVCALAAVLAGCGGGPPSPQTDSGGPRSGTSTLPSSTEENVGERSASNTDVGVPRAVVKDSGAVYLPPDLPTEGAVGPGRRCEDRVDASGARASFPPSPGISATRVGNVVKIRYHTADVPRRCAPVSLRLVLDVNDDPLPGRSTVINTQLLKGHVDLKVPVGLEGADVVRAIARTAQGAPSDATAVVIRR